MNLTRTNVQFKHDDFTRKHHFSPCTSTVSQLIQCVTWPFLSLLYKQSNRMTSDSKYSEWFIWTTFMVLFSVILETPQPHSSLWQLKHPLLCSTEEGKSFWEWVNDKIFTSGSTSTWRPQASCNTPNNHMFWEALRLIHHSLMKSLPLTLITTL